VDFVRVEVRPEAPASSQMPGGLQKIDPIAAEPIATQGV